MYLGSLWYQGEANNHTDGTHVKGLFYLDVGYCTYRGAIIALRVHAGYTTCLFNLNLRILQILKNT